MSVLALAVALSLAATPVMAAGDLSAFQWENRVLVVFGPGADPATAEQLRRIASEAEGLSDRDMVVLHVDGDAVHTIFGTTPATPAADRLREQLDQTGDTFAAVLVGKDGGVKLRRAEPVATAELFGLVDTMPMRQSEMHR